MGECLTCNIFHCFDMVTRLISLLWGRLWQLC